MNDRQAVARTGLPYLVLWDDTGHSTLFLPRTDAVVSTCTRCEDHAASRGDLAPTSEVIRR